MPKGKKKKVQKGMNRVAVNVALLEGGKVNLPIAQIKQVFKNLKKECKRSPKSYHRVKRYLGI